MVIRFVWQLITWWDLGFRTIYNHSRWLFFLARWPLFHLQDPPELLFSEGLEQKRRCFLHAKHRVPIWCHISYYFPYEFRQCDDRHQENIAFSSVTFQCHNIENIHVGILWCIPRFLCQVLSRCRSWKYKIFGFEKLE